MRFHVRFTIVLKIHAFNFENWLPSTMVLNINCNRNNERNCQKKRRYLWHYWTQLKFFSFNYEESLKTEPWLFTSMIPTWWRHVVLQLLISYIYDSYLMTSCCSSAVDCLHLWFLPDDVMLFFSCWLLLFCNKIRTGRYWSSTCL